MEKEELIKIREESAERVTYYSKKKKKYGYIFALVFIISLILFFVGFGVSSKYPINERPTSFYVLVYLSLALLGVSLISISIYIFLRMKEKSFQKKRDRASYELTSISFKNIRD